MIRISSDVSALCGMLANGISMDEHQFVSVANVDKMCTE